MQLEYSLRVFLKKWPISLIAGTSAYPSKFCWKYHPKQILEMLDANLKYAYVCYIFIVSGSQVFLFYALTFNNM